MKLKLLLPIFFIFLIIGQKLFAAPVITSFSPASGPVGTLVTVNGSGLNNPTAFTIGGTASVIMSNTGTQLVAMVMASTSGGAISIQTSAGTASFGSFTTTTELPPGTQLGGKLPFLGFSASFNPSPHIYDRMVAVSADGSTAIIGGSTGKVYTRSGDLWTMQAQLPAISPVAISGDGNTISSGKAVYVRTGTSWAKQGPDLIGSDDSDEYHRQGYSVALSADGNTLIEGNPYDQPSENSLGVGAAWVFTRSNGVWTQQGKLVAQAVFGGFGGFGYSVSLSADGNTAAIGSATASNNGGVGGVFVFKRTGTTWQRDGNLLYGTEAYMQQGISVAISADGNTIVEGGVEGFSKSGGAWIFVRKSGVWEQQGGMLQGTGGLSITDMQGNSVAITADGNTVFIGGPGDRTRKGAAWFFTRLNGNWTQYGDKYTPTDATAKSDVGKSVALSADGKTALIAASTDSAEFGAVWFYKAAGKRQMVITYPQLSPVTYGKADIQTTATSSKADLPIFYSSSDTTVATITATGKIHIKKAGSTNITVTQTGNDLYADAVPVVQEFIVNKAPLTVSADNKTLTEGFTAFVPTASYAGFVKGENLSSLTTVPTVSTTATSSSPAGIYPITANGGVAVNYQFIYVDGTLTVIPVPPGPPKIASFSPATGQIGSLITISGSNLGNPSAFSIGGKPAVIVSNTANKLVGMIMPGAVSGPVVLTTDSGTVSSGSNFNINATALFPVGQLGPKVTGTGSVGASYQGVAIALSADGSTAIVGGHQDNSALGAAWIFVRSGDTWVQQGSKLVGTGGNVNTRQGVAVALSADGNTAVVGGDGFNNSQGAAWVFVRDANGNWSQQGDKLIGTGAVGNAQQGGAVAITADGNTIVIGGSNDNNQTGAAWVFVRENSTWLQQGNKIVGAGSSGIANQGTSVDISADGSTLLVGAPGVDARGAWAFSRLNKSWIPKGTKFGVGNLYEGGKVKLSADGKTAVLYSLSDNQDPENTLYQSTVGSFQWINGSWQFQTNYTTAASAGFPAPGLGASADVQNILFTAPGDPTFAPILNNWKREPNLVLSGGAKVSSVAMSANGMVAAVGSANEDGSVGGVRFFVPADYITFTPPPVLTYGVADTTITALSTNTALPITFTSDNPDIVSVTGNKLHVKTTGTVNITASQASDKIAPVTRSITISKAQLTITADNKTKIRGTENPVFTASYSGFKNGDDSTALSTKPVFSTTALINSPVGSYPITVSGGASAKYQLHYVGGTLRVTTEQFLTKFVLSPASNYTVISQSPTLTTYKTSVAAGTQSVTLTPYSDGTDVQQVTINGVTVAGGMASAPIQLDSAVTTITMVATTKLGTVRTYVIEVHKDGSSDVRMKILALAEPSATIVNGIASVSPSVNTVRVLAVPMDSTAQVKVNGVLISGDRSDPITLNAGSTPTKISVEITTAGGSTYAYYFQVNKSGSSDVSMKTLALADPSAALEALTTGSSAYNKQASVSFSTNSVRIYAVPNDPATTVKVNGVLLTGEQSDPVALTAGNSSTNISVVVTAQNGTTATYTIQVNKTGSSDLSTKILGLINPSAVLVTGSSSGTTYNKTASVSASATSVTVRAVPTDPNTTVKVNGTLLTGETSAPVILNAGNVPTDINVLLTAETGVTRTYVIHVSKTGSSDITLKTLKLTNPTASVVSVPAGTLPYDKKATVPALTSSVKVYAVANDATSTIKVNGTLLSGAETAPIALNSDTTIITVLVTSESGSSRTYLIGVSKAAASMQSFAVSAPPIATEVVVHQALSPNGDGQNDVLVIDGLADKKDNHISIVDVNGSLVYETKAYGSNGNVFDGHSGKTGTLQKPGTYYYVLDYNDGAAVQRKTGYIILKY